MDELENLDFSEQDKQTYNLDLEAAHDELQNALSGEPEVVDPSAIMDQVKDQGFVPDSAGELAKEAGKALVGGGIDAVDSVGSFLDLSGDTILT